MLCQECGCTPCRRSCKCGKEFLKENPPAKNKMGSKLVQKPLPLIKEHDTVTSRITGKKHEISLGPIGGGLVPANPFASIVQEGYMHAHPEKLGKAGLAECDAATHRFFTKGKHLPQKVKK